MAVFQMWMKKACIALDDLNQVQASTEESGAEQVPIVKP